MELFAAGVCSVLAVLLLIRIFRWAGRSQRIEQVTDSMGNVVEGALSLFLIVICGVLVLLGLAFFFAMFMAFNALM